MAYQDLSDLIESGVKEHDRELYQKLGPVLSELRCILAQIYDPDSEEEEKQPSQSRSGDRSE